MKTVFDVPADKLIAGAAEKLEDVKEIVAPEWMKYAKTGSHKERAPEQRNFWQLRCASLMRQIYINGPIGLSALKRHYGGAKGHTVRRAHKRSAGGSIIRKCLQQLEKTGYVDHKKEGRTITAKGKSFLNGVAKGL